MQCDVNLSNIIQQIKGNINKRLKNKSTRQSNKENNGNSKRYNNPLGMKYIDNPILKIISPKEEG